jgi:hypothetical protein
VESRQDLPAPCFTITITIAPGRQAMPDQSESSILPMHLQWAMICYSGWHRSNCDRYPDVSINRSARFHRFGSALTFFLVMALALPAHAFRCGNRIVIEKMHEQDVRGACGEPSAVKHLGLVLRHVEIPRRRGLSVLASGPQHATFPLILQEVAVTEFFYNFGPRKFKRRLVFEGGILVSIEPIGYGYRERRD